jgi:hypothetical protein
MLQTIRAWWMQQRKRDQEIRKHLREADEVQREAQARREAEDPFAIKENEQPPLTEWWTGPL